MWQGLDKNVAESVLTYAGGVAKIFYPCGRGYVLIKVRKAIMMLESEQLIG